MTVSNKKILLALAIFVPEEVAAFAIPSLGRANIQRDLHPGPACKHTTPVLPGDTCGTLAERCNISEAEFISLNTYSNLCKNLASYKALCCCKTIQPRSSTRDNKGQDGVQNSVEQDNEDSDPAAEDQNSNGSGDQQQEQDSNPGQDHNNVAGAGDDGENNSQGEEQNTENDGDKGTDASESGSDESTSDESTSDENADNSNSSDEATNGDQTNDQGDDQNDDKNDDQGDDENVVPDTNKGNNTSIHPNINKGNSTDGNNNDNNGRGHLHLPGPRTGNWTKIPCDDPAMDRQMNPAMRWGQLDAASAFKDAMDQFKNHDRDAKPPYNMTLLQSISNTFGDTEKFICQDVNSADCSANALCDNFAHNGTGPAAMLIHNSLTNIHSMFHDTYVALQNAKIDDHLKMDSFIETFAPVPAPKQDDKWVEFILDIVSMGAMAGLGGIVKSAFKVLPALEAGGRSNDMKAATESLLGGGIDRLRDMHKDKKIDKWDIAQQHDLKADLGNAFKAWADMIAHTLFNLFQGDDKSIDRLGNLINNGKMIGSTVDGSTKGDPVDLIDKFSNMMLAAAVAPSWRLSGHPAFIVDTGLKCDVKDAKADDLHLSQKIWADKKAEVCIDGLLFYLAMIPDTSTENCPSSGAFRCDKNGICNSVKCGQHIFSLPPGIDALDGKQSKFGSLSAENIIHGAVKTYRANGNKNGDSKPVDYANTDAILDLAEGNLEVTGLYRLPVCSHKVAWEAWKAGKRDSDIFPCNDPNAKESIQLVGTVSSVVGAMQIKQQ